VAQGIPVTGATGFRYLTKVSRPSMWEGLGLDERRYLLQLPVTQRVTLDGKRYLLVHATPRDPLDEYLLKDPRTWAKRLHNVDADVVCVGHTHIQFNIQVNGVVVLNPGSVGLPRDGDPRAAFAIIDGNKIEMKRVAYPVEETITRIEGTPWPRRAKDILGFVLRSGRLPAQLEEDGVEADVDDEPDIDET
jgi:diadenosine tetraphosphatase ApaH/serine/threonine PP2A family protein phosphatase